MSCALAGEQMAIGQKVRAARERKGWTQRDLAEAANTSNGFISVLENSEGENHSLELLRRVADALEMPLTDLVELTKRSTRRRSPAA